MEKVYTEFEIPKLDLDLPEIDIPELDLGDLTLIEDYSLSIGSGAETSLPD